MSQSSDLDPDGEFFTFFTSVRQAEAEFAIRMPRTLGKAGKTDRRAALEWRR